MTMLLREENGSQKEKKKFQFENLQKGKKEKSGNRVRPPALLNVSLASLPRQFCYIFTWQQSINFSLSFPFLSFSFSSAACPLLA